MAKEYHFKTSQDVPSGHAYRKHPMALNSWARKFKKDFKNMELIKKPASGYFKRVVLRRVIRNRRAQYDYDNYVFGCKPLVDWLVKKGLIRGDNPSQVTVEYKQWVTDRRKDFPHVEIELYE